MTQYAKKKIKSCWAIWIKMVDCAYLILHKYWKLKYWCCLFTGGILYIVISDIDFTFFCSITYYKIASPKNSVYTLDLATGRRFSCRAYNVLRKNYRGRCMTGVVCMGAKLICALKSVWPDLKIFHPDLIPWPVRPAATAIGLYNNYVLPHAHEFSGNLELAVVFLLEL